MPGACDGSWAGGGQAWEILVGLAKGWSNRELAENFFLSEGTIKTHVSSLLSKLGLRSRVQAVIYAYEAGVVRVGE